MKFNPRRVKAERVAAGISQQEMAVKMNMSRASYWKRERGVVPIGSEELAKIATILNIPASDMYIFLILLFPNVNKLR